MGLSIKQGRAIHAFRSRHTHRVTRSLSRRATTSRACKVAEPDWGLNRKATALPLTDHRVESTKCPAIWP